MSNKPVKAYVLISGGLDSTLAVKMLQQQGVTVVGVYVSTGFCVSAQQKRNGRFDNAKPDVYKVSEELGIELEVIDISREYISIVANPRYGWGKNVNPCIDCRIHMLKKTAELMEKQGGDFIATGEVLGQRPMSQRRHTMDLIERASGLQGKLLRPLSARFFPATQAETSGLIDRTRLGQLQGRGRKNQLAMAKQFNLQNIQSPAGGCCYLTDENYAVKFKDMLLSLKRLLKDPQRVNFVHSDMIIMSIGRQVKIRTGLKLACGRNETENNLLHHYRAGKIILTTTVDNPGPSGLLEVVENQNNIDLSGEISEWNYTYEPEESLELFLKENNIPISAHEAALCASIIARYSDGKTKESVQVELEKFDENGRSENKINFHVSPLTDHSVLDKRLMTKKNEKEILKEIQENPSGEVQKDNGSRMAQA